MGSRHTNKMKSTYRESQTPAQQLYGKLCGKSKTRPDPVVSEGLAFRALRGNIEKYTPADISVMGMICRRLKGFTHINVRKGSLEALNSRTSGRTTARKTARRRNGGFAQQGPGEDEMQVLCSGIAKSLSICPRLTVIELPGLELGSGALKHLGRGLCQTSSLKRLDLRHCGIGDEGLAVLVKALVSCKSLSDLCLASNHLRDTSAPRVSSIIRRHAARRDDGYWASCLRDGTVSAASSRGTEPSAAEMAVQLRGLTALDLSNNHFSDDGICHIATTLESDGWLVALNMRDNPVTTVGAQSVMAALDINESLSVIDFRPREQPPKFDDMGHIISSPKRSRARAESMAWAMRRRPRKGISADHPEVQQILARWGLVSSGAGAASRSGAKTARGLRSTGMSASKSKPQSLVAKKKPSRSKTAKGKLKKKSSGATSTKTRMAMSKAKGGVAQRREKPARLGKSTKTPTGDFKSNKDDAPPAPNTRSSRALPAPKKSRPKKSTRKKELPGKASRSVSNRKSASPRKKKSKATTTVSGPVPDLAAISQMERPKSARGSSNRSRLTSKRSVERPKTARGGNRSRRHKGRDAFGVHALHPGIVGLGEVEPPWQKESALLSVEATNLINAVYDEVAGDNETGTVPVRDIILSLRKVPSAPAILQFRDRSNPPANLLEQGKMINRAGLLAFFEQHARAVQAVSPTGKSSVDRWASPRSNNESSPAESNVPMGSEVAQDGIADANSDPAVLEVLEGWVDQLHGYIDKIEQGIEIPVAADIQGKCMQLLQPPSALVQDSSMLLSRRY